MAEISGLVIGVASLLASFQTCLTTYDQIVRLKHKSDDLDYYITRISFEQHKLSLLVSRLGKPQPGIQPLIESTLKDIKTRLDRLHSLLQRHVGSIPVSESALTKKKSNKFVRGMTYAGGDGLRIEQYIAHLKELNEMLSFFVPAPQQAGLHFASLAQSVATPDPVELRNIQAAARDSHTAIALAAEVKATRIEEFDGITNADTEPQRSQIFDLDAFEWALPLRDSTTDHARPSISDTLAWGKQIPLSEALKEPRVLARYTVNHKQAGSTAFPVLVEWREGFRSTSSVSSFRFRLDQLTHILCQMYSPLLTNSLAPSSDSSSSSSSRFAELTAPASDYLDEAVSFGILPCLGWLAHNDFSKIGLVFRLPYDDFIAPLSLHDRILRDRRTKAFIPPLGSRFAIALGLTKRLANLIVVDWIHKAVRSDNVMMIDDTSQSRIAALPSNTKVFRHEERLYLTGFSYAKPINLKDGHGSISDLSILPTENQTFSLYRPPHSITQPSSLEEPGDKIQPGTPTARLDATFDVYGLGIVLLEIGLWRTIASLYDEAKRKYEHNHLAHAFAGNGNAGPPCLTINDFLESEYLTALVEMLGPRTGLIYQRVVEKCLKLSGWKTAGDFSPRVPGIEGINAKSDDNGADKQRHAVFLESIIIELSRCSA